MEALIRHVERSTGLHVGRTGAGLTRRLEQLVGDAGVGSTSYLAHLAHDSAHMDVLLDALTVGETYFLRDPAQLDHLRTDVLPDLARMHERPLRIWSAGCASGEEAYTLAFLLGDAGLLARGQVTGTDLSPGAVAVAKAGVYSKWSLRGMPAEAVQRYLAPVGDRHRVRAPWRDRVRFETHNLADATYPAWTQGTDLVVCRNVLLYLTPATASRVGEQLVAALAPGGWLVTSPADPDLSAIEGLERVRGAPSGCYRRPPTSTRQPHAPTQSEPIVSPARPAAVEQPASLQEAARQLRTGHLVEAESTAAAVASDRPLDPDARYLHAQTLFELGRHAEAADAARATIYLRPESGDAHLLFAQVQAARGDAQTARRAFRRAAALLRGSGQDVSARLGSESPARLADLADVHERLLARTRAS